MKRILTLCLILGSIASFAGATVNLSTETWFDYNTLVTGPNGSTASQNINTNAQLNPGGQFFIGRAYLTLSGDLGTDFYGDPIYERITFDFANAALSNAAGLIKYAYFDYDLFKTTYTSMSDDMSQTNSTSLKSIVFSAGIVPVYFGNISFWQYPLPIKDAVELYKNDSEYYYGEQGPIASSAQTNYKPGLKVCDSADLGLMLSGRIIPIEGVTSSLVSYYIQLLNGEGYKNYLNNNGAPYNSYYAATNINAGNGGYGNTLTYQFSLFLSPLDGTLIGGSYRVNPYDYADNGNNETYLDLMVSAKNVMGIPIDFVFQYINENVTNNWSSGVTTTDPCGNNFNGVVYSVSLGYGFADWAVEPMIRYDYLNPWTGATNSSGSFQDVSSSILYFGGSIKLDQNNLTFKPLVGKYLTENGQPSGDWLVWVEFAYKLNFTIWQ